MEIGQQVKESVSELSRSICDSPKLETTQMVITMEYYSTIKKERVIDAHNGIDESQINMPSEGSHTNSLLEKAN